ncbi:SCO family protein [Bradyrhizobium sp. CCBAU 51627]|uniref:SCO family protein n=1 Tax=Bradyrhizobium sp. CCBAU 51627 TaxID=1325088 RepID=UPI002305FFC4|nr:SCO family protein [Bradyrhizobium sp. CCBAU 51627]
MPAQAAVTASALDEVNLVPRVNILLPLHIPIRDVSDRTAPLQSWLGGVPTVWILADYTCQTLCGPAVSIVSNALADSGLKAGQDYRLIVFGLDPRDGPAQAQAMKSEQVSPRGGLPEHSYFLRAETADVSRLLDAFGVRTIYDREHDQFAHPAAAFVVTSQGRISRALSALSVDAPSLRLALVEAGQGRVGRWTDQVHLLCYGFDPASGVYTLAVRRLLLAAGSISVIVLALLIGFLFRGEAVAR